MTRSFFKRLLALAYFFAFSVSGLGQNSAPTSLPVRGLPFIHSYSLADIGNVPRGSHLGFDQFGRVAAIHEAVYSVLNDNVWLNISQPGTKDTIPMTNVIQATDGRSYYGARSSWGIVEMERDGWLRPIPFKISNPPDWLLTAVFRDLLTTPRGVYFVSWNGMAYWDFKRAANVLLEVPGLSAAFKVGDRVYVSALNAPLRYIDPDHGSLVLAETRELDHDFIERATPLDDRHSLVSFPDGRLEIFDGQHVAPWPPATKNVIKGRISTLQQLVDGRVAVAATGQGLLIFSREGDLLLALTSSRYLNISAMANREPGVLWVATEDAIDKVLYGGSLSVFGESLGLPVDWPIVVHWKGRIYVASGSKLYEAKSGNAGEPTLFRPVDPQPIRGAISLAASEDHMLVGNGAGAFEVESGGAYKPIPSVSELVHLVMIDSDHCYEIGRTEMALVEWKDGRWKEAAPRIPGLRNPSVVHRVGHSVWMEMGGDGVARLWNADGRLHLDVVPNASWTKTNWVNIGAVGDIAVLSSLQEEPRRYFDETTGKWCQQVELEQLLNRSPYWIARAQRDENGVIWATHNEGMVRFTPSPSGYIMDATAYDLVNDRYPIVRILPGADVWMFAERSLYHVEQAWFPSQPPAQPVLVSVVDTQNNTELLTSSTRASAPLRVDYASSNLTFRFYSGSDAYRRLPAYQYRLGKNESWTPFDGSLLGFRGLREGSYRLQVRRAGAQGSGDASNDFEIAILPPWHRSWPAYILYGVGALLLLWAAIRWSNFLQVRRNHMLERVVHERTRQLESTMEKLSDETRNAATLAERDRLANEIHDSVQQGLTGAILQLDATLKLPIVGVDLRSRLNVVRNMVSYARQEVEHAVWDMESPLLDGADLSEALQNLTTFVNSGEVRVDVYVSGDARPLDRAVSHHLLRIAQEATTNAFRHAQAQHITIRLEYSTDSVSLEIADDGQGFAPKEVLNDNTGHLGLRGICTRAKKLRGSVSIESSPGKGTTIRVSLTVPRSQNVSDYAAADYRK